MIYLLDTSVIIGLLRKKEVVKAFISKHVEDEIITSCICEAEIAAGIYREEKLKISLRKKEVEILFSSFYEVVPFDSQQAYKAGEIHANLAKRGELIDDMDILIAASALHRNAILITLNVKHFLRVSNLSVESIS